jgi:hypothetical protein
MALEFPLHTSMRIESVHMFCNMLYKRTHNLPCIKEFFFPNDAFLCVSLKRILWAGFQRVGGELS